MGPSVKNNEAISINAIICSLNSYRKVPVYTYRYERHGATRIQAIDLVIGGDAAEGSRRCEGLGNGLSALVSGVHKRARIDRVGDVIICTIELLDHWTEGVGGGGVKIENGEIFQNLSTIFPGGNSLSRPHGDVRADAIPHRDSPRDPSDRSLAIGSS